jgi:hypothetical protein
LNREIFGNLLEAKIVIQSWRVEFKAFQEVEVCICAFVDLFRKTVLPTVTTSDAKKLEASADHRNPLVLKRFSYLEVVAGAGIEPAIQSDSFLKPLPIQRNHRFRL